MKNSFLLAVSAVLLLSVSAFAHKGATGVFKERMDNFKASQLALKQVLAASKRNDFEGIVPLANQIKNRAEIMPTKFPSGSDGPPSEAAPAIWIDFEGFKSAAKENFEAASFL
jgi:cytochrome c556